MKLRSITTFLASIALIVIAVCVSPHETKGQEKKDNGPAEVPLNYRIGVGDVLKLTVFRQELLSKDNVRVGNDGTIRIPMVDDGLPAACLTEVELADSITQIYREYLLEPKVTIDVVEFQSNPVALIGAVNAPGRFDLRRPTRLLELLTYVNGPASNAGDTVQIIRDSVGYNCSEGRFAARGIEIDQSVLSVKLSKTLKGEPDANPLIESGDIITVAEAAAIPEAYVIGNVTRATPIKLNESTTLTKAIAMAGGTVRGAKLSKIRIYRQDPETLAKTEITVNLKEVREGESEDILLRANDIVEVPGPSGAKKFFSDIFRILIPTVGRVIPVY